jgi:hypothetical protein
LPVDFSQKLDFDFFYRRRRRWISPSAPNPAVSNIPEDGSGMDVAVTWSPTALPVEKLLPT